MKFIRKRIVPIICAGISLIILAGSLIAGGVLAGSLDSQLVAQRWQSGDLRYAQVSIFLQKDAAFSKSGVTQLRQKVDEALAAESIQAANKDARLWIDAFSGETTLSASSSTTTVQVRAICTGGDFFTFHPVSMASGWYYSDLDIMDDGVIIDRTLAWKLYGGYDLTGMSINIAGNPCIIAGVAELPDGKSERDAYGEEPTVYVSFDLLKKLGQTAPITCYEAVVPDPVGGFAEKTLKNAASFSENQYEMLKNTERFSLLNSLKIIGGYAKRAQRTTGIVYTWWENAARYLESYAALFAVVAIIGAVYPAYLIFWGVHRCIKMRKILFKRAKEKITEYINGHPAAKFKMLRRKAR